MKKYGKIGFQKHAAYFCLSREKVARKNVDEIDP
jgi:hypothetical protein